MNKTRISRRTFLKVTSASSATAGIIGIPTIIPSTAIGAGGSVAPSNRIAMGFIGLGGQGTGLMRGFLAAQDVRVAAVCDVDTNHRNNAANIINTQYGNQDCAQYGDFREVLARKDIDAVCVATPDHWHALISIAAAKAGKDIYCEKPLANSVGESKAVRDAVLKYGRVLQTGSHERSRSNARFAAELVRNGYIGKLNTIRIQMPTEEGHHNKIKETTSLPAPQQPPAGFDYNMWLGHTPVAPYYAERCHFWWRFILNYGGGEMTDRGAHVIDIGQLGNGADDTGPVLIDAKGWDNNHGLYTAFMDYEFVNTFENGVKLIGSTQGPRGCKFEGAEGWVFLRIHEGTLEAEPASLLKEDPKKFKIQLGRSSSHLRNFLDCVKSREKPLAHVEIGNRTATICHLNNLAMRLGRKLNWDPKAEKVIGDDEANNLLAPAMRGSIVLDALI